MSTSSLGGPSRLRGSNNATQMKRHSAFDDLEDEEYDERPNRNGSSAAGRWKDEALSGYSARDERREKGTQQQKLVIQKQADANWMEERKRRLGLEKYRKELGSLSGGFGGGNRDSSNAQPSTERVGDEEQKTGLEIRYRSENADDDRMQTDHDEEINSEVETQPVTADITDEDTEARAALLSGKSNSTKRDNVIITPITEEQALQRDMDSRPDAPSLSDYASMPVDDFGAALLRGMGWQEGMGAGKQRQGPTSAPQVKKRAALLGLGAKEREPVDDRDNKKGGSSHRSSNKPERRYVPVTRKEREEEESGREPHSKSSKDRKRSYSPPSSRGGRYDDDRERSRRRDESRRDRDRHDDRYSDRKRSDRDYDRRRDDRSRRDDHRDRHRSER
ncbi:uncharacterized protein FA14DRAFT_175095 [Meira miltonrushii]|uniref:G-patch domain-containing protein n=1 Tax=Meira miltonrushii TaxID=1280837 RepID=A0A316V3Y5_9BASI|nr:uncharacterized protein FA14DRAFT_175095 [Meira miltonrushii]PWN32269.1 hypothetical protein FA14DRAFT_175095 [Meira miltonrushii]